jgi:hypothetical protein
MTDRNLPRLSPEFSQGGALQKQTEISFEVSPDHKGRVPHISLVFREMWDSTAPHRKEFHGPIFTLPCTPVW